MSRADLLALTTDDLVVLANRGIVKRAQREAQDGAGLDVAESADGTVTVTAADATTTLAPGVRLEDARCTCDSAGLCRHVVRAVLAYQAVASDAQSAAGEPVAWDPGAIADDVLEGALRRGVLTRARARARDGVALTLVRAVKPVAKVHDDDVIVRFLVPGDLAYARCSCTAAAPC